MAKNPLYNQKHLKQFRRDLRNNGTPADAILWKGLKAKQLQGRRFRRQFSVGNCILDFYCVSEKLAIELDGDYHWNAHGLEKDKIKEDFLKKQGIKLLRFDNYDVYQNPSAVLEIIASNFK